MNMNVLETALIALTVLGYMLYRQVVTRPVTRHDLLLPLAGGIYFGGVYFGHPGSTSDIVMVAGATLFGIGTGLASAAVVNVWRDGATGLIMQREGWRYLLVLLGLVAMRVLLRVVAAALKLDVSASALNDVLIGMAMGNYAGRAMLVSVRALSLLGWHTNALPSRRDVRALR